MAIVITIFVVGVLIAVHELGHYLVARACRMRADRFAIGFGPALFSVQGKRTQFRIGMIPLGGYVRIAGLNPHDGTPAGDPESFTSRPLWQRIAVIAAGPVMNYALAYVLLVVILVAGRPVPVDEPVVGSVVALSAAAHAGLRPGDRIASVDEAKLETWTDLVSAIQQSGGKELSLEIERKSETARIAVKPDFEEGAFRLGLRQPLRHISFPFGEAVVLGVTETLSQCGLILAAIPAALRRDPKVRVGGPVAIVQDLAETSTVGWALFARSVVFLSLALFLFNLLPVPALDGGRLVFLLVAALRGRPVSTRVETWVHGIGFVALMAILLAVTVADVGRCAGRLKRAAERGAADASAGAADGGVPDSG